MPDKTKFNRIIVYLDPFEDDERALDSIYWQCTDMEADDFFKVEGFDVVYEDEAWPSSGEFDYLPQRKPTTPTTKIVLKP